MADFPYLPIKVAVFLADTQHLDARETGAYASLLFTAWLSPACGLPNDDKKLARMARCSPREWLRIRPAVMAFWQLMGDGLWHQKALDKTRSEVSLKSSKASSAAQAKWLKDRETRNADADAYAKRTLSERIGQASPKHLQSKEKEESESSSSEISTDPPRDVALGGGSTPRGKLPSVKDRVAALAVAHRQKLVGNA